MLERQQTMMYCKEAKGEGDQARVSGRVQSGLRLGASWILDYSDVHSSGLRAYIKVLATWDYAMDAILFDLTGPGLSRCQTCTAKVCFKLLFAVRSKMSRVL